MDEQQLERLEALEKRMQRLEKCFFDTIIWLQQTVKVVLMLQDKAMAFDRRLRARVARAPREVKAVSDEGLLAAAREAEERE